MGSNLNNKKGTIIIKVEFESQDYTILGFYSYDEAKDKENKKFELSIKSSSLHQWDPKITLVDRILASISADKEEFIKRYIDDTANCYSVLSIMSAINTSH